MTVSYCRLSHEHLFSECFLHVKHYDPVNLSKIIITKAAWWTKKKTWPLSKVKFSLSFRPRGGEAGEGRGGRGRYITWIGTWHISWDRYPFALPLLLPCPFPSLQTSDVGTYPCYWHLVVITKDLFELVHLRTYPLPQPVLISSGSHKNMHGWQAGSTHPTEILSCFKIICV